MTKFMITTESGSQYIVWVDGDEKMTLSADNVANPLVPKLPRDVTWRLTGKPEPWPPMKGQSLVFCMAASRPDKVDVMRTSPVRYFYEVHL